MLSRILSLLLLAAVISPGLVVSAPSDSLGTAMTDASQDSSLVFRYGALYESRIDLERSSDSFPWNDPERETHLSDRLSLMALFTFWGNPELFVKGGTGVRAEERSYYEERFALEQGHISFRHETVGIDGRLFLRERIYRSGFLLLPLVTPDRPFTSSRGEGLLLEMERWGIFGARYIESALRNNPRIDDYGGLPLFSGGADLFRHLEAGIRDARGLRFELSASQARSIDYGDVVILASGLGIELLGLRLDVEMARSIEGDWDDVRGARLFELDLDGGSTSDILGEHVAVSGELDGLLYSFPSLGTFHLLPGYRYSGEDFINPAGETAKALVESYLIVWWTHPELDLLVTLGARDRYEMSSGNDRGLIEGSARVRLRGGLTARGGILHEIDHDPSLLLSLSDENSGYRLLASARIDDAGGGNDFSFLTEGALNLTGSVSVRSTLLFVRSAESFYNLGFDFRPSRRYLLGIGFGSFRPFDEEVSFRYDRMIEPPARERFIMAGIRVWLGEI